MHALDGILKARRVDKRPAARREEACLMVTGTGFRVGLDLIVRADSPERRIAIGDSI